MPSLLAIVGTIKPREKSGGRTMARYGFQVHVSILKMLDLHRLGRDYRAAFDHFDDLMVFDKSDEPDKVAFFQIKSKGTGTWTLREMSKKAGEGPPPNTFVGRLHHHMASFGAAVSCLGFVSNLAFKLKLKDGTETTPDHHVIRSNDLHSDEIQALKATVAKDSATSPTLDGSRLFVFERTALGLMDQESLVKGRLLDYIHERSETAHVPIISLYETLRGSVLSKSSVTQEFTTTAEFYDRKTLCRADLEAMFSKAIAGRRFHESWPVIQQDLLDSGMLRLRIIALQNNCIRYISARSAGESGAVGFNTEARSAILAHRAEVDACTSLPEIAAVLDQWISADYENSLGALYVEAFEAIR